MEDFDKGAKRKCTSCSTLFFDFGKSPIICPNCGVTVSSLLTNVSKQGRPPKVNKDENPSPESNEKIDAAEEKMMLIQKLMLMLIWNLTRVKKILLKT